MLFFLLLGVAPAMNYPNADDDNSPRKKWLEIDSQILNALFCVTGFGLAFWRFRDLYYFIRVVSCKDKDAMQRLATQNKGWFRPPAWARDDETLGSEPSTEKHAVTFTGNVAPPTALWKLAFNIIMMVLNTIIQCVLSYYMWAYNRLERPVRYTPPLSHPSMLLYRSRLTEAIRHGLRALLLDWAVAWPCSLVSCRGGKAAR